jgi:hypothetical protein
MKFIFAFAITLFVSSTCLAQSEVWTVDDDLSDFPNADFTDIQSAIEASKNGNRILVYPGTYTKAGTATNVITYQNKNISIQSTGGSAVTIIDGENTKRPVQCFSSGQLLGFTLTNGYHSVRGGGLSIGGPNSPTIRDCVIRSNSSPDGGGLSVRAKSSPVFNNCTIEINSADDGGGIYVVTPASALFIDCTIQNNTAKQGGGGFHCEPNTNVALQDSTVCGNTNGQISGELDESNSSGNSISELCTIDVPHDYATIQEAIDAASDGDTVLIAAGTHYESGISLTDKSITISGETHEDGSPATTINGNNNSIFSFTIYEQATELVVQNLTLKEAYKSIVADGYDFNDPPTSTEEQGLLVLNNCVFTDNTGRSFQSNLCRGIVSECLFVNNTAGTGAAMYIAGPHNMTVVGCAISGNSTTTSNGAAIEIINMPITIIDTLFCNNTPTNIAGNWTDGGNNCLAFSCDDDDGDGVPDKCAENSSGVYVVDPIPNIGNFTSIQDAINSAPNGSEIVVNPGTYVGSGDSVINTLGKQLWIHSSNSQSSTIIDGQGVRRGIVCTSSETNETVIEGFSITNCYATDSQGGDGVYLDTAHPSIIDCAIYANTGIGLRAKYSEALIESCTFQGNGGGIRNSSGHLVINDCLFAENTSIKGGAIWSSGGESTIAHSTFEQNEASNSGGALYLWSTIASLTSCDFHDNSADVWGGAILADYSELQIDDCTISNNAAPEGSGIFAAKSNIIFVGEDSTSDDIKLYDHTEIPTILQFSPGTNCAVTGNVTSESLGSVIFDIDSLDPQTLQLDISESLTMDGSLSVRNDSGSLLDARVDEIVPLAQADSVEGDLSSVVFPIMPPGLGLQLIEQASVRGGETELAVEVVEIAGADFSETFSGDLDSTPIDMISFNANNEGSDELAILYGGTPGGVTIYSVSSDGIPTPIEGFNAITGDDPVDIDAGDINGDGLDDLIVANSSNNSVTVLLTLEDANGGLSFDTFSLEVNDSFGQSHPQSCVSIINWDGDQYLDVVAGVDSSSTGYRIINDIGLGQPNDGPWFDSDEESPTSVDGGDSLGSAWGFVAGTSNGRIQYATSGEELLEVAQLGDTTISYNIVEIEASDMNDGTGDGLLDLMIASDDAEMIFLMEGEMDELSGVYGFGELIPIYVGEEMTDVEMLDADSDGDVDILLALPDSDTPLLLLRNDGAQGTSGIRTGGLDGRTWSKESENENTAIRVMTGGSLSPKDDEKDWVTGGSNSSGTFRGDTLGVIEQTNISFGSMCSEDLNRDGIVGVEDLLILIAQWGTCSVCSADFDGDAIVGVEDLLILIAAWGPCE